MTRFSLGTVCLALSLCLCACGIQDTETWKTSKDFYYTHVNGPASLSLEKPETLPDADSVLVERLMPIDRQIAQLERALSSLSGVPTENDMAMFMERFPWLSALTMVNMEGKTLASVPPVLMKPYDPLPLLARIEEKRPRDLKALAQDTPLGPELLLGRPLLDGTKPVAMLIASFDVRALLPQAGNTANLLIRTPETVLWSGDVYREENPVQDWQSTLKSRSYGTMGQNTVWLVRNMAGLPLIFATHAAP